VAPLDLAVPLDLADLVAQLGLADLVAQLGLADLVAQLGLADLVAQLGLADLVDQLDLVAPLDHPHHHSAKQIRHKNKYFVHSTMNCNSYLDDFDLISLNYPSQPN
jgi:hypothetical protein